MEESSAQQHNDEVRQGTLPKANTQAQQQADNKNRVNARQSLEQKGCVVANTLKSRRIKIGIVPVREQKTTQHKEHRNTQAALLNKRFHPPGQVGEWGAQGHVEVKHEHVERGQKAQTG